MPSFHSGHDVVGILCPPKGPWVGVGFGEKSLDGGLKVNHRAEHAAQQAVLGELCEIPLDGVQPRRGGWGEMEGPARVALQPLIDLRMLVGGVIVDDGMNRLARWDSRLGDVQEADKLLMPVALHAAADHRAVEHVQRREQRRGAVPLVVVRHRAAAALLHR